MEELMENIVNLKRHLNTVEHMIYVSCKFTRTTEMLRKVMENIVYGYEEFFKVAYDLFVGKDVVAGFGVVSHKIQMLNEAMSNRGIYIDLSDYFLLKKLLISDFDSIGMYRKNLSMVSFIDGEEYVINMAKLLAFYENLKNSVNSLRPIN